MTLQSGFASFGTTMPKVGITKFKAKKGETRIKILSLSDQDFLMARYHYMDNIGSFFCFGGSCCQAAENSPNGSTLERAILPIAVYTPNLTGGITVDYAYLALPETKYSTLVSLHNNVGDVSAYDLLINCTDETYQKWEFTPLANQAPLINNIEGELQRAELFLASYRMNIKKTIGKEFNEQTFQAAIMEAAKNAAHKLGANPTFVPNSAASQVFAQPQQVALPTTQPTIATQAVTPVQQPQVVQTPIQQPQVAVTPAQPVIPQVTVTPVVESAPAPKETKKATKTVEGAKKAAAQAAAQATTTPVVETGIATGDVTTGATAPTEVVNAEEIDWSAYISQ